MNLHDDAEAFNELITGAANELHMPVEIIEKDYFVTLALKKLNGQIKDMVFKGGTSLMKCYRILDRFSEDIDISYTAESGVPGDSRKRKLKKAVIDSVNALGFTVNNIDETRSRRDYNCYRIDYPSVCDGISFLKPQIIVETYVALLPFPTVIKSADNYLYRFLVRIDRLDLAEQYDLMPFPVTTQTLERTLIDKVFAICDYYLENKTAGHSRHLYDISKICESIRFSKDFEELVGRVRAARAKCSRRH